MDIHQVHDRDVLGDRGAELSIGQPSGVFMVELQGKVIRERCRTWKPFANSRR
jgi:hypothetical protein